MSEPKFEIYDISDIDPVATEPMGSKEKFWVHHPSLGMCLFKIARADTGEDWAEKVAAHLADRLGLPHARYELAHWHETRGVISPTFLASGSAYVPGNEILGRAITGYPSTKSGSKIHYRVPQHTVRTVLSVIEIGPVEPPIGWQPFNRVTKPAEVLVGYLLLDAWIGHTDRHDENWGFVLRAQETNDEPTFTWHLAPTFDHASSLGRNEPDDRKAERLSTKDEGFSIRKYTLEKCKSALYAEEDDRRPLTPIQAFEEAAQHCPEAALAWVDRLGDIRPEETLDLLHRVPRERMSPVSVEFAQQMLMISREALLRCRK